MLNCKCPYSFNTDDILTIEFVIITCFCLQHTVILISRMRKTENAYRVFCFPMNIEQLHIMLNCKCPYSFNTDDILTFFCALHFDLLIHNYAFILWFNVTDDD